jgi:ribonucleotide reductase beta subunit family protein with ferritin-like domain
LKSNWRNVDPEALQRMSWFDVLSSGVNHQDFFAGRVSDYSKGNIVFDNTVFED